MNPSTVPAPAGQRLAVPPGPALAGMVRYFHVEWGSAGPAIVPASPYPMVTFFAGGGPLAPSAAGPLAPVREPMLCGPVTMPLPVLWQHSTAFISALIEPAAFARLFGISPAELRNAPVPLAAVGPMPSTGPLEEVLHATRDPGRWVAALQEWLLRLLNRRAGSEQPFIVPAALLALPTADIARRFGVGERQLERRFQHSYGQSLRDLRRMARYVRALAMLMQLPPRRGLLTRIAMDSGYHDQAHMIRDFIAYTGRPPGAWHGAADDPLHRMYRYDAAQRHIVARA